MTKGHREPLDTLIRLTPAGKRQLTAESSKWDRLTAAITRIMRPREEEG